MKCPKCGHWMTRFRTITRDYDGHVVVRMRRCNKCPYEWKTWETMKDPCLKTPDDLRVIPSRARKW